MKISAVIDNYNSESFIVDTIKSVLAQTRLPDELLIVGAHRNIHKIQGTDQPALQMKNLNQ